MDWANLGFEFRATKSHIKFVWKNGQWDQVRIERLRRARAKVDVGLWV